MENIYGSVAHLPDGALSQLGQQMNVPQFRNPLPTANGAIGALINGSNMGSLTGLGQQYLGQNRIYVPNATDFNAVSMASNSNSIAGVQSMSDQLYQSAAAHNQALQQLEGQLAAAPDEKGCGRHLGAGAVGTDLHPIAAGPSAGDRDMAASANAQRRAAAGRKPALLY